MTTDVTITKEETEKQIINIRAETYNRHINVSIEQGQKGDPGPMGPQGPQGPAGGSANFDLVQVYHIDNSPSSEYLNFASALAAVVSGDIVELPSGIISGDNVLPSNVTVCSRGSTTLTGSLTLADNTIVDNLNFVLSRSSSNKIAPILGPSSGTAELRNCWIDGLNTGSGDGYAIIVNGGDVKIIGGYLRGSTEPIYMNTSPSALVDTFEVPSTSETYTSGTFVTEVGHTYRVHISGTFGWWVPTFPSRLGDPQYVTYDSWATHAANSFVKFLDDESSAIADDPTYNTGHSYDFTRTGNGSPISLINSDGNLGDNSGSFTVTVYDDSTVSTGTAYVYTVQGDAVFGSALEGDRAAFDALVFPLAHANDTDTENGIHHTLGTGANEAAAGNHSHEGSTITSGTSTDGYVLTSDGAGNSAWEEVVGGSGDVIGPNSSVDSRLASFDGLTGKLLKDSGKTISDFANVTHTHSGSDVTTAVDNATNADTLDGSHAAAFALSGHIHNGQAVFTVAGVLTVASGTIRIYNCLGRTVTISKVFLSVGTAPATQAVIADVNLDGTTIFTNQAHRPEIAASAVTGFSTNIDVASWADGHYLTVDLDQIGVGTVGSDLTIHVVYS